MIRKYAVWIALGLTLAAAVWVSQLEDAEEAVSEISSVEKSNELFRLTNQESLVDKNSQIVVSNVMQRPPNKDAPNNIFTAIAPVETMLSQNAEAPTTTVSVNPFIYAGKIVEDGKMLVFLIDGEKSHAVKAGDVIEDIWKIMSIKPPNMTIKYIPLNIEMQMEIGVIS